MSIKIKSVISLVLVFLISVLSVSAKETMFGSREEWLISENYIKDVFKYDFEGLDAKLLNICTVPDAIEVAFTNKLKSTDNIYIDGESVPFKREGNEFTRGYVYRVDISDFEDNVSHTIDVLGKEYMFKYVEYYSDDFDAPENPGWQNAEYTGDGKLTVEKQNIAYLDGDGVDVPSFKQQKNWNDYILEVKIDKDTPKSSRMYFSKYCQTAASQNDALSYSVRDYNYGNKFLTGIAYSGLIKSASTYQDIVTASAGAEYKGNNAYSRVLGTVCPWQNADESQASVCFQMYELGSEYRIDTLGSTITETTVVSGNSSKGGVVFSNFENIDGKKMVLDSIRIYKILLKEELKTINVDSVVTTSDKLIINYSGETEEPYIVIRDEEGNMITPSVVNTSGVKTYISTESIPFGKVISLKVASPEHGIMYEKNIKRTLNFTDDATGDDINANWSMESVPSGNYEENYVNYNEGSIECHITGGGEVLLAPKNGDAVSSEQNQTVEYTISNVYDNYDISAFMLSENIMYNRTDSKNFFVKYQGGMTRARHTYKNPSTYWQNASGTKEAFGSADNDVVQIADNTGVEVYVNNGFVVKAESCVDESVPQLQYATVPSQGTIGWRFVNGNGDAVTFNIKNVKVMSVETVADSDICWVKGNYKNDNVKMTTCSYANKAANVIVSIYDEKGCVIGKRVLDAPEGYFETTETINVSGIPGFAKVFIWESLQGLSPLCKDTLTYFG